MIVVSDASPIHYLVLIGAEHVLPAIFGGIIIPPMVRRELLHAHTPAIVKNWMTNPPEWIQVQTPSMILTELDLDAGEMEGISLSLELHADAILIDDRKGRLAAAQQGLTTIGTLTVLEIAAGRGLVSLENAFKKLLNTNFRVTPRLIAEAFERHRSRPD